MKSSFEKISLIQKIASSSLGTLKFINIYTEIRRKFSVITTVRHDVNNYCVGFYAVNNYCVKFYVASETKKSNTKSIILIVWASSDDRFWVSDPGSRSLLHSCKFTSRYIEVYFPTVLFLRIKILKQYINVNVLFTNTGFIHQKSNKIKHRIYFF